MKIGNPKTEVRYWDEGNPNKVKWYKKGNMKKILRKRYIKKVLKETK